MFMLVLLFYCSFFCHRDTNFYTLQISKGFYLHFIPNKWSLLSDVMSLHSTDCLDVILLGAECGCYASEAVRMYRERFPPPYPINPHVILIAMYWVREFPIMPRASVDDFRGVWSRTISAHVEENVMLSINICVNTKHFEIDRRRTYRI